MLAEVPGCLSLRLPDFLAPTLSLSDFLADLLPCCLFPLRLFLDLEAILNHLWEHGAV